MTSFTLVANTSFTSRLKFPARRSGDDAVEKGECGRPEDAVCDSSDQRDGADVGFVPRVWDFPTDGLSLAAALPADRQPDAVIRAQPAAARQPVPQRNLEGAAGCGPAPTDGLWREKIASPVARGRRDSVGGADDSPDPGASRSG